ncbi:MAG: hypothetical protein QOJ13_3152 [Gaiellales bacterium]|nr:hypothetical protein [Gaiellales bacterium]
MAEDDGSRSQGSGPGLNQLASAKLLGTCTTLRPESSKRLQPHGALEHVAP